MSTTTKYADVNGTRLAYIEAGTGETLLFIHGAVTDSRFWLPQIAPLHHHYRCIALDQRFFGLSWPGGGSAFSLQTHVSDLCEFISMVSEGPVHAVATSYGSGVVLASAAARGSLFKTLFLNEPSLPSVVTDPADIAVLAQARKGLAPAVAALTERNEALAAQLFCDWTAFEGAFAALPADFRQIFVENARTVALQLASPAPSVTAADIARLDMPVGLTVGEKTIPFFSVQLRAVQRALPHAPVTSIPGAHHAASFENAPAFNAALRAHLESHADVE